MTTILKLVFKLYLDFNLNIIYSGSETEFAFDYKYGSESDFDYTTNLNF